MSQTRSIVLYGLVLTLLMILLRVFILNVSFISNNFLHNDFASSLKGSATGMNQLISSNSNHHQPKISSTGSGNQYLQFRYYSKLTCKLTNLSGKFIFILNTCVQNGDTSVNATNVITTINKNNKKYEGRIAYFNDVGCTIVSSHRPRTATFPGYNKCFPTSGDGSSSGDALVVNGVPSNPPSDDFNGVALFLYSTQLDCLAQDIVPLPPPTLIEKHYIAFNKCIPAISKSQNDFQLTTCDIISFRGIFFTSTDGSCQGIQTIFTYPKAEVCINSNLSYDRLYSGYGNYRCFS
jgi:hypothetical protein